MKVLDNSLVDNIIAMLFLKNLSYVFYELLYSAEIVSRLHEFKFQLKPRMKSQPRAEQSSLKIELFCFCEEFKVLFTVNDRLNAAH
jgi:hypothetical protein